MSLPCCAKPGAAAACRHSQLSPRQHPNSCAAATRLQAPDNGTQHLGHNQVSLQSGCGPLDVILNFLCPCSCALGRVRFVVGSWVNLQAVTCIAHARRGYSAACSEGDKSPRSLAMAASSVTSVLLLVEAASSASCCKRCAMRKATSMPCE